MTNTLNLAGKLDAVTVSVLTAFDQIATALHVPYVLVGATARDILLHHGYGIRPERATADIDMAIQVNDWALFLAVRRALLANGFSQGKEPHRVHSAQGIPLDIIPFGGIENDSASIEWPTTDARVMNMMGFTETHAHAQAVMVQENPNVIVPVVMPAGLVLLKLVAWTDRDVQSRKRDAHDIFHVMKHHESMPGVRDRSYDNTTIMEKYGWDTRLTGAHLLGIDAAEIALPQTREYVTQLLIGGMIKSRLSMDKLIGESMLLYSDAEEKQRVLLAEAFRNGFCQGVTLKNKN